MVETVMICKTYNCLPNEGGLLDQDPLWVFVFLTYERSITQKQEIENRRKQGNS